MIIGEFVASILTSYIFYFLVKYGLIILAVIFGLKIICAVINLFYSAYLRRKTEKAREEHGDGSIAAKIADANLAAATGNADDVFAGRDEMHSSAGVLEWFHDVVSKGRYSAIRNRETKGEEPNYAIIMNNYSGYDFKEFSAKVIPGAAGKKLAPTRCVAKDWKNGTEGELWFYCPSDNVNKLSIHAEDLSYELEGSNSGKYGYLIEMYNPWKYESSKTDVEKNKTGKNTGKEKSPVPAGVSAESNEGGMTKKDKDPEYTIVSVEFSDGGKKYDYICDLQGISAGDRVVVDANNAEKTVRVMGVNIVRESELSLPLEKYKHIIRKAGAGAGDTEYTGKMPESSDTRSNTSGEDYEDEDNIRERLQDAMDSRDYDTVQDMLDMAEIDTEDIDPDFLEEMEKDKIRERLQDAMDSRDYDTIQDMLDMAEIDETDIDPDILEEMEESDTSDVVTYGDGPYICPVCFEPYDGIFCDNCGHSNDIIGAEELSDTEKISMGFAAIDIVNEVNAKRKEDPDDWDMWDD